MVIRIKPLEWGGDGGCYAFSDVTGAHYSISCEGEKYWPNWDVSLPPFDAIEAAREAAQTDYERRILSALTTEPAAPREAEAVAATWTQLLDQLAGREVLTERAQMLRSISEHLRYRHPPAQAVTEAQVEAVARHVTKWLGYSWEGLGEGSVVAKGFPVFTNGQFGWGFQGRQDDMRALARDLLTAAQEASR